MQLNPSNKEDYYQQLKTLLSQYHYTINPYRDIQYGLQFLLFKDDTSILIRIYEGKQGLRIDFSQANNEALALEVSQIIEKHAQPIQLPDPVSTLHQKKRKGAQQVAKDPDELIGIDESGKGDYFGPLVIAAVYTNQSITTALKEIGVQDSKALTDSTIQTIATKIKSITKHSIIVMGNESYNEVYNAMNNLNHMLAWGHAKVLEDTLKQSPCPNALADQFGNASLIENALISKGIDINLYQRHRAESNIAVAAASILARDAFVTELKRYEAHYNMPFPKGCSDKTTQAGVQFCETHGREYLEKVAKLHFKVTDKIDTLIN